MVVVMRWLTVMVLVLAIVCLLGQWMASPSRSQPVAEPAALVPVASPVMLEEIAALRAQHGTVLDGSSLSGNGAEEEFAKFQVKQTINA